MSTCKWCGKSGFFLSVTPNGLCGNCNYPITLNAREKFRLIEDSIKVVMKSRNLDTKLSRLDFIIEQATYLLEYENKNINMFSTNPSVIIESAKKDKVEAVRETLSEDYSNLISKIEIANSFNTKINELNKFLLKIQNYKGIQNFEINKIEKQIIDKRHELQLNNYLEAAKKAEFKNETKKAISQYQEALYFLKNDDIDDKFQKENIKNIEGKIKELKS